LETQFLILHNTFVVGLAEMNRFQAVYRDCEAGRK